MPTKARAERLPADLTIAMNLLQEERFEQALAALQELPPEDQINHDVQLLRAILLTNRGASRRCQAGVLAGVENG